MGLELMTDRKPGNPLTTAPCRFFKLMCLTTTFVSLFNVSGQTIHRLLHELSFNIESLRSNDNERKMFLLHDF